MQRNAKAAAKRARREAKRNDEGSALDGMMAHVDEFGHIVDIEAAPDEASEEAETTPGDASPGGA